MVISKHQPVVVEVSGGVVTNVWNVGEDWVVLDWDNLLGDGADATSEWDRLPEKAKEIVLREYPEESAKVAEAIRKQAAANAPQKR